LSALFSDWLLEDQTQKGRDEIMIRVIRMLPHSKYDSQLLLEHSLA
jgi:hypothetical protein